MARLIIVLASEYSIVVCLIVARRLPFDHSLAHAIQVDLVELQPGQPKAGKLSRHEDTVFQMGGGWRVRHINADRTDLCPA